MQIVKAGPGELEKLIDWAAKEGWNPGLDDAAAFHAADPDGYFVAKTKGEPIAGISVVTQSPDYGFLGLYLCVPEYRGQGIGWSVWQAGMQYLDNRVVGLDGVVEQQPNYRKSGFEFHHRNIRFSGKAGQITEHQPPDLQLRPFDSGHDLPLLVSLDAATGGFERAAFFTAWTAPSVSRQTLLCWRDDRFLGFGTIRQCRQGHKIGPLIAADQPTAVAILSALAKQAAATDITLDVPEPNDSALSLCRHLDLLPVFETARMYRGPAPSMDLSQLFGVATLELG